MSCYCKERETNPGMAELMTDIPVGYCGLCDACGRPGHTRAHPNLPTTGAWCEKHWEELTTKPAVSLNLIVALIVIMIAVVTLVVAILSWL